jgi:peptidoglycan hydrolase-like protein with peptidoglycan-binding domain
MPQRKGDSMNWKRVGRGATIGAIAAGSLVISAAVAGADIHNGSTGTAVRCVQRVVHDYAGISIGPHGVDGQFGDDTERGVRTYQTQKQIGHDGRVGPITGHVMYVDVTNIHRVAHNTGDTDLFNDTGNWLNTCPAASSYFR